MIAFFLTMPIKQHDADDADDVEPGARRIERQQRADAGGRKRGQDRDRVDEALIEHPEHDIHGRDRRREQEDLVRQRRLKRLRRALEADGEARRQVDLLERLADRIDRLAERRARREVERDRGHRKLFQMRDLQRRGLDREIGDRSERRLAGGRGRGRQVDRIERFHRARHRRIDVEDDAVLVALGEDGRDDALAVGVVERVVDDGGSDAEARGVGAVEIDDHRAAVRLQIARHIDDRGNLLQALQHLRRPGLQRRQILVLEGELILGRADGGVDGQVLHRLHEQRYARNVRGFLLDPPNDLARRRRALRMRLEVDEEAARVERDVRAVDADERGQAFDVRIGQDHFRQRLLMVGHLVE